MNTTLSTQATPESIMAILQETAKQQKIFAAEYEAQRKKDAEAAKKAAKEYEAQRKKATAEYDAQRKAFAAEYEAQQKAYADKYAAQREKDAAESNARLEKIEKLVGNISNNNGHLAEDYFYNALDATRKFGNIKFDLMIIRKASRCKFLI
jgi:membrane protein involved in colicin uptake